MRTVLCAAEATSRLGSAPQPDQPLVRRACGCDLKSRLRILHWRSNPMSGAVYEGFDTGAVVWWLLLRLRRRRRWFETGSCGDSSRGETHILKAALLPAVRVEPLLEQFSSSPVVLTTLPPTRTQFPWAAAFASSLRSAPARRCSRSSEARTLERGSSEVRRPRSRDPQGRFPHESQRHQFSSKSEPLVSIPGRRSELHWLRISGRSPATPRSTR